MGLVKILIVEDEAIIAEDLRISLEDLGYEVTGVCDTYEDAMAAIEKDQPDLIMLDIIINGPRDGISLAADIGIKYDIPFIFLTSHADQATVKRAKSVKPAGYLLKPYEQDDLYTAIEIGLSNYAAGREAKPDQNKVEEANNIAIKDSLFVRDNYAYVKITFDDIHYLKSDGNYVRIYTKSSNHMIRGTLKETMDVLPESFFFKTNRSFVVNIKHITSILPTEVQIGDEKIPLSKESREALLSLLQTL